MKSPRFPAQARSRGGAGGGMGRAGGRWKIPCGSQRQNLEGREPRAESGAITTRDFGKGKPWALSRLPGRVGGPEPPSSLPQPAFPHSSQERHPPASHSFLFSLTVHGKLKVFFRSNKFWSLSLLIRILPLLLSSFTKWNSASTACSYLKLLSF